MYTHVEIFDIPRMQVITCMRTRVCTAKKMGGVEEGERREKEWSSVNPPNSWLYTAAPPAARTLLFSALAERHEYVTRLLRNDGVEVFQNQSFNLLTPLVLLVQIASLQ